MKNLSRPVLVALVLVLLLLSVPLWLPSLQTMAASDSNPVKEVSTFYVFDGGWITGSAMQKVLAVPQVLSWSPGKEEVNWQFETGFISGGFRDPATDRIYITEQRSARQKSLLNLTFSGDAMYSGGKDWIMYLTILDGRSGKEISHEVINLSGRQAGGASLHPIGLSGDTLFLMNYSSGSYLFAYDLVTHNVGEQSLSLCEHGYLMQAELLEEPTRVAALCMDYSEGMQSWVTMTDLEGNQQSTLEMPSLGKEGYETGNGIFVANGKLFAVDTDAGALVEIDMDTMQVANTSHYRDGLDQGQSSLLDDVISWLSKQIVSPAAAKRWMALTAVSPDGRWLVVDGGLGASQGTSKDLILVDLQTLQATRSFEINQTPMLVVFARDGKLLVLFDKRSLAANTSGVLLDVTTAEQQTVSIPTHGWIREIIPAD